jgi:hypothetical protein
MLEGLLLAGKYTMHMARDELSDYLEELQNEIRFLTHGNDDLAEAAFTEDRIELLKEQRKISGGTLLTYAEDRDGNKFPAARISAWSLSSDGTLLEVFVTKYFAGKTLNEIQTVATREQLGFGAGFVLRVLNQVWLQHPTNHAGEREEAMQAIYSARGLLTHVKITLLTNAYVKNLEAMRSMDGVPAVQALRNSLPTTDVIFEIEDLDKFSRYRVKDREVIKINFETDYGCRVPCIESIDLSGEYRTYLAFIPGRVLSQIYGRYNHSLLEQNVRAFLQDKGKVNKGLQDTLKNSPSRFLAYNNGLCCTASRVDVSRGADGLITLNAVRDFQIVNGGQTTASVYFAATKKGADVSNVVVQMKLTVIQEQKKLEEFVPLISQYANSQNKINGADFAANGVFHRDLENLSRSVYVPASGTQRPTRWFYERARGAYGDGRARCHSKEEIRKWDEDFPRDKKFTKTDLAKYEHAWEGLPDLACLGADKNFFRFAERLQDEKDEGKEIIATQEYFRNLVSKAIIWQTTERVFDSLSLKGYRSNTVAYTMAWLAQASDWRINLAAIWEKQSCSEILLRAIRKVCPIAYAFISEANKRGEGDGAQASKKASFWRSFRIQSIELPSGFETSLVETPSRLFPPVSEYGLQEEWDRLRAHFLGDQRTMGEVSKKTGADWFPTRTKETLGSLAQKDWSQLSMSVRRANRRRQLIKMMSFFLSQN